MYCTGCGTELKNGAKFCKICGKPINNALTDSSQTEFLTESLPINSKSKAIKNRQFRDNKKEMTISKNRKSKTVLLVLLIMLAILATVGVCLFALHESGIFDFGGDKYSTTDGRITSADNGTEKDQNTQNNYNTEESHDEDDDVPDISGEWVDTNGERSYLEADLINDNEYQLTMYSSNDTKKAYEWEIIVHWDSGNQRFIYDNSVKVQKELFNGTSSSQTIYSDGTGSFYIVDNRMYWVDDKEDAGEKWVLQNRDGLDDNIFLSIRERAMAEPIVATLLGYTPTIGGSYMQANITSAIATSNINQTNYNNTANMMFDRNDNTSWQEGVAGYGIGERIAVTLSKEYKLKYLSFKMGNWRDDHFYAGNCRPKTLTIIINNDFEQQITFDDIKAEQWIELSHEVIANQLIFIIDDVYIGGRWEDTCINEIGIYGS